MNTPSGHVHISAFGQLGDREIHRIALTNDLGYAIEVLTLGAIWHAFRVPVGAGGSRDVLVKPAGLSGYLENPAGPDYYFGASIGRFAGRIGQGGFQLDGRRCELYCRDGIMLHGGPQSLAKKVWEVVELIEGANPGVLLRTTSPDGEGGYPGELVVYARYVLKDSACQLTYYGQSDRPTVLNMTNHAYFRLGGPEAGIARHQLQLGAVRGLELGTDRVPTGRIRDLSGGMLDYAGPRLLGQALEAHGTLDDVFLLDWVPGRGRFAALADEAAGLRLEVTTNQPAVVVFTPERLEFEGALEPEGAGDQRFPAICLETQNYPDAPNQAHFPSALLRPAESYLWQTQYQVGPVSGW